MKRLMWIVVPVLALAGVSLAGATSDVQNKLMAKRAAEADCYRKLAERIMGLKITGQTLVRDFVTESDEIQTEVNTFIRGIRLGKPRYFEDGSCEVRGEVTYKKVVACLREVHSRHYKGNHFRGADFKEMETRTEVSVISAVGTGAPRPDAPIEQADGTVAQPAPEQPLSLHLPSLWKQIGPQGRLMAKRAAELDAYRRLAEQLRGFKITSQTSVKDFVAQSDEIATELNTTLRGAREVHVFYHDDEPIVEVTLEIPWQKVIGTIRDSYTNHIHNDEIKESVFNELNSRVEKKYFRATGMGIPPERFVERARPAMKIVAPDWLTGKPISATGQAAVDNKGNAAQAKLMATRAAELDAKRKLAEMVGGLQIDGETRVRDFLARHDSIRTELDAVIDGAYVKNSQITNGTAQVTVEVPPARVWKVIADELGVRENESKKAVSSGKEE